MQTPPKFKTEVAGASRTTVLSMYTTDQGYTPIARFYADRFDQALLDLITSKLNA